jgi:hypothetical protein
MTLTVNLFDGSINASLAVGFQTVDSILIVLKRMRGLLFRRGYQIVGKETV